MQLVYGISTHVYVGQIRLRRSSKVERREKVEERRYQVVFVVGLKGPEGPEGARGGSKPSSLQ